MTKDELMQLADTYGECLYLRTERHDARQALSDAIDAALKQARSDALEEAAKVCEDEAWRLKKIAIDANSKATNSKAISASACADAIRALKKIANG